MDFLKRLVITISLFLLINSLIAYPAYSRGGGGGSGGGCFSSGTSILTPEGSKKIEQLHSDDYVTNYNFSTHHQEKGIIGKIEIIDVPDYYLINHRTKVTGTHPFYVKKDRETKLIEVQNLQKSDRLITQNNSLVIVSSIEHINQPISVYNLLSINPNHNFYADGFLVHNKGGTGRGSYGIKGGSSGNYATINQKTLPGLIKALIILVISSLCIGFWQQIWNFVFFLGKQFTEDTELIEFITKINPDFKNKYSIWYIKDNQIWQDITPQSKLAESQYQHLISKAELIDRVSNLVLKYQHDWTVKNFQSMNQYISEPFYSQQKQIFRKNFGNSFDLIYNCRLSKIVPIDLEFKEHRCFFRVQINGEMINFKVSETGYILTGKPYARSFSEYWDLKLIADKQLSLVNITQIKI
jgi:hypothetical protein